MRARGSLRNYTHAHYLLEECKHFGERERANRDKERRTEPTGTESVAQARLSLSFQEFQLLVAVSAPPLACDVIVSAMYPMRLFRKKCAHCCSIVS